MAIGVDAEDGGGVHADAVEGEQRQRGTGDSTPDEPASTPATDGEDETARRGEEAEEGEEGEEEEEETCGFCIFMKGGGCKDVFEAWSKCVDSERGKDDSDFTETCRDATIALRECMLAHKDYYQPLLDEEEREMEAKAEAEAEAEAVPDQGK